MFGLLLILWKNGRIQLPPYGYNILNNNMIKAFISVVIFISCSVCASGDLEIFPEQKFDSSSEEQPTNFENPDGFYRRPLKNNNYFDFNEIKRKLEILEYLDKATKNEEPPFYFNFDDIHNKERKDLLRKYILRQLEEPHHAFEEPRPYPVEEDFTFHDENYEDEKNDDYSVTEKEASGKGELNNLKVVEDPTVFAYPPSDPRFFQNQALDEVLKAKVTPMKDNKIFLKNRSDGKFKMTTSDNDNNEDVITNDNLEVVAVKPNLQNAETAGVYIIAIVAGISAAGTVGLIAVAIGWYNLQKHVKNASDVEYPAYGVTGPNKDTSPSSGDRRLAQSAQMYHYQHQKQQIIAMESRAAAGERPPSLSEAESDEENEEGDYTVYECPGLAPTGEMEVKNPLFQDDPTPAQTPQIKNTNEAKK